MSQLAYFMNENDTREFLEWLFEKFSPTLVEERGSSPELARHTAPATVVEAIHSTEGRFRFSVTHPAWTSHDLEVREIHRNDGGSSFFCLSQREGGPSFDFIASRSGIEEDETRYLVDGMLSDYPTYHLPGTQGEIIARPEAMVHTWREFQKYTSRNALRTTCREKGFLGPYVFKHALAEYRAGLWLRSGPYHFDPRGEA